MRVRDIVRTSFGRLAGSGALPAYQACGRYTPPVVRHNPTWRPQQIEPIHYNGLASELAADPEAWRRAASFVRTFTAAAAGRGALAWQLPAWSGSFGEVPAPDLLHHVTFALGACGLRAGPPNTITHTATLDATDAPTVAALPEAYGLWLQVQEGRPRWTEKVELRLVARVRARIVVRADGRFDSFADVALSAPAISLMDGVAAALDRRLPPGGDGIWLPRPPARVTWGRDSWSAR